MNDRQAAAVIHHLTSAVDGGAIIARRDFTISESSRTPGEFDQRSNDEVFKLFREWLPKVLQERSTLPFPGVEQDEAVSTYWPRLNTPIHAWIDWSWSAQEIARFVQAFDRPYPGAKTYVRGGVAVVRGAELHDLAEYHPYQRGMIFRIHEGSFFVAASGGSVRIAELILESGAKKPRVGDRLFTPARELERALATRVQYLPDGRIQEELAGPLN